MRHVHKHTTLKVLNHLISFILTYILLYKEKTWRNELLIQLSPQTFSFFIVAARSLGLEAGMGFFLGTKAIPIKCFVFHRPPSREGGSVGRAKKINKNKHMKGLIGILLKQLVIKMLRQSYRMQESLASTFTRCLIFFLG